MKKLLSLLIIAFSFHSLVSQACDEKVIPKLERTIVSDYPPEVTLSHFLPAYTEFRDRYNILLATYKFDTLIYHVVGSVHSGWFKLGVVVDARGCEVVDSFVLESE